MYRSSGLSMGNSMFRANCLDRHLAKRGDQVAIIWEGDDPKVSRKITYKELHEQVSKFANVLKSLGLKKGDRATIYLPMIPELAIAMLACTRIGVIHSIVFAGFFSRIPCGTYSGLRRKGSDHFR